MEIKSERRACPSHCCVLHGCKYGYDDCPVATKQVVQDYVCEQCSVYDGIQDMDQLHALMASMEGADGDLWKMNETFNEYAGLEAVYRDRILELRSAIRKHKEGLIRDEVLYALLPEHKALSIDREALYDLYMAKVAEECDWVTHFGPKEIVNMISELIEENPKLMK